MVACTPPSTPPSTRPTNDGPARWRWTSGRSAFYAPVPDTGSHDVTVNGDAVQARGLCRLVNHAGSFLAPHGVAGEYGLGAPDDGRFDTRAERFGFSGTAPVFRTETLQRLGGLEPRFFAYNEDTDWCLRVRLAGQRIVYDPAAVVRHRLSATSQGARSPLVRFLAQRNALLCLVRNAPADVARRITWRRLREAPEPGLRLAMAHLLPWALASRVRMRHQRTTTPVAIWERWAGADMTWDTSPAASFL